MLPCTLSADLNKSEGEIGMYGEGGAGESVPVEVGDELTVKIEAVGEKGDGIAKKDGFVLFVPNTKEGEEVRIRVTKVLRKVRFAEVVGQAEKPAGEAESTGAPAPEAPEETEPVQDTEDFGEEEKTGSEEETAEEDTEAELPEPPEEEKEFVESESEEVKKE